MRCARCGRTQPPLPRGVRSCVYCSSPLPVQRWRADPPLTARPRPSPIPAVERAYLGPPSYRGRHPKWGFPPVVWRRAPVTEVDHSATTAPSTLPLVGWLCLLTGLAAALAAGSEAWRYVLLLRGRTQVLPGDTVLASDRLVTAASLSTVVLGVLTAALAVPLLVRLHGLAAYRLGLEPSRKPASVLARLVVPGWNLYGLGVIAGEIDGGLSGEKSARPRLSGLVIAWWAAWAGNAVVVLVTLVLAFRGSVQAIADTVELHIFVDLAAAAVAILGALVFRRFRRSLHGPRAARRTTWVVSPPEPTRGGQPATLNTAPGSAAVGPKANQATVSASASGDQPDAAAEPEPTTTTPIP